MGAIEEGSKVASGIVESLRSQPLALSLIVINVLYLGAGLWFLSSIGERSAHRDDLIMQLVKQKDCS